MGASQPPSIALAAGQGGHFDAADVIALLREVYADGIPTRAEAEELIAFDHSLAEATPGWREFFATALADHVVEREAPAGAVDDEQAEWLIGALSRGRRAASERGFAAVLRVLETAREASPLLSAHAIRLIAAALVAGEGSAIGLRAHFSRMIDADGVALLQRVLVAGGGAAGRPVSRAEAEALFDLHDAVAGGVNDPAFGELFFRAIAHHLIAASDQPAPPRKDMLAPTGSAARDEMPELSLPAGCAAAKLDAELTAWLASCIMRDGRPTAAEHALLRLFSAVPAGITLARRPFFDHAA